MAKTMGSFSSEIHKPLLGSPGPGPMYRLNPPLIIFASQGLRFGTPFSTVEKEDPNRNPWLTKMPSHRP